jgi:hypothetical protein
MKLTPEQIDAMSHWDEAPGYPVENWELEVSQGETRQGYKDWVKSKMELEEEDEE